MEKFKFANHLQVCHYVALWAIEPIRCVCPPPFILAFSIYQWQKIRKNIWFCKGRGFTPFFPDKKCSQMNAYYPHFLMLNPVLFEKKTVWMKLKLEMADLHWFLLWNIKIMKIISKDYLCQQKFWYLSQFSRLRFFLDSH